MNRVLIIRFSSLGDVALTLPAVDWLCSRGVKVHYLTKEAFRPLIEEQGLVEEIHTIPNHASLGDLLAKVRGLKSFQFDFVYDLHRNLRSRIVTLVLRRPHKTVSKFRFREWLLFILRARFYRALGFSPIRRLDACVKLIEKTFDGLGQSSVRSGLGFGASDPSKEKVIKLLESNGLKGNSYVCISAESAWKEKEWAFEKFLDVARNLEARGNKIVWVGLRRLTDDVVGPKAVNLTGALSLEQLIMVLGSARAIICNDSGVMHIAEAQKVPAVAVFGPTTRELGFAPHLEKSEVVEADLWCRPCSKTGRFCIRPFARRKCLADVNEQDVLRAALRAIDGA